MNKAVKFRDEPTPDARVSAAIEELQARLAHARIDFDKIYETEEKRLYEQRGVFANVIIGFVEFMKQMGTDMNDTRLLAEFVRELADIQNNIPSSLLQVNNQSKRQVLQTKHYEPLCVASAAVTVLIESGKGLEASCREVTNALSKLGMKLDFPTKKSSSVQNWQRLQSWRNNCVSGKRNPQFYETYALFLEQARKNNDEAELVVEALINTAYRLRRA